MEYVGINFFNALSARIVVSVSGVPVKVHIADIIFLERRNDLVLIVFPDAVKCLETLLHLLFRGFCKVDRARVHIKIGLQHVINCRAHAFTAYPLFSFYLCHDVCFLPSSHFQKLSLKLLAENRFSIFLFCQLIAICAVRILL